MTDNRSKKFFGEAAFYGSEQEKEEARKYLEFWKKNLLFKLRRDSYEVKIIDEQWIERDPMYVSALADYGTISLKLCLEADFYYELGKYYQ